MPLPPGYLAKLPYLY